MGDGLRGGLDHNEGVALLVKMQGGGGDSWETDCREGSTTVRARLFS